MLKKYLLGLFVGLVGFVGFSSCNFVNVVSPGEMYLSNSASSPTDLDFNNLDGTCYICNSNNCSSVSIYDSDGNLLQSGLQRYTQIVCGNGLKYTNSQNNALLIYRSVLSGCFQECETCPEINTGDILSGSCDINYCVENDLCPTSTGSRSELVINDIVHEGKPLINVSIPDDIYWDYSTDDNQFDLYVGSGYNQEYIDSILAINSYRPDNEDFTNIFVSGLTLIFPYIFLALLFVFMWKLLKRIFK